MKKKQIRIDQKLQSAVADPEGVSSGSIEF